MMRVSGTTTASVAEIMRRAHQAFGMSGAGLTLVEADLLRASWRHEASFVNLAIEPGQGVNIVVIETRELDDEVMRFLRALPQRSAISRALRRFKRS